MALEKMLANEYAAHRKVSNQCVCKALRKAEATGDLNSKTLIGIKSFERIGRYYDLTVDPVAAGIVKSLEKTRKKSSKK